MPLSTPRKREGLRKVYRASAASESARSTYLDGLADTALSALNAGKSLVSVSAGGTSTGYAVFNGWAPNDLIEFVDWARDNISESTIASALDEVPAKVTRFSTDFSGVRT